MGLWEHGFLSLHSWDEAIGKMQPVQVVHAGLASGTWLILGKEKVQLLEMNGFLPKNRHLECKPSWNLSSYPGPGAVNASEKEKGGLSNQGESEPSNLLTLSWVGAL